MLSIFKKIFGSRNERVINRLQKKVEQINQLEPQLQVMTEDELRSQTHVLRKRLEAGESLEALLPHAFATVREVSRRVLGMRHFDVQLIGGMVLHYGNIAEMKTGEGKTLSATLPAYLHALSGKGVHIVTVNDYLAARDANWMAPVYEYLGLTVGINQAYEELTLKKAAYAADITYGTNNEFGFDYLRDNMAFSFEEQVQRTLNFAIVDEVDSILIDEARTPLIISGQAEDSSELYMRINQLIPQLKRRQEEHGPGDYYLDEKSKQAFLTDDGHQTIEDLLTKSGLLESGSLYAPKNILLMHHVNAALRAHTLFSKDVDYIVANNEVVIVDEHTGRLMQGRRWSDGLHQAVEAKEQVKIQNENQTLASITFQNYFRLYKTLSGMTGTADTEAYEFQQIYGLEVVVIPTNQPMIRQDNLDKIYLNQKDKFKAILQDIKACLDRKQPVLVGTIAIETSEALSKVLTSEKINHQVLNAKYHAQEAKIIAEAGRPGMVTIATNMAGRGTDIVLGGSLGVELAALPEDANEAQKAKIKREWQEHHQIVVKAGGLRIIGTERHESRRIDNQLRGRSGRQGDPGSSQFYLSLEDNLMRIFASDRVGNLMKKGIEEGEALESGLVHKVIEYAQRKVEGHNFDVRKQLLEYDDVANDQRKVLYEQRNELLSSEDVSGIITEIRQDVLEDVLQECIPLESMSEQWDLVKLEETLRSEFNLHLSLQSWLEKDDGLDEAQLRERIIAEFMHVYQHKMDQMDAGMVRHVEKSVMLQCLDLRWRDHLVTMDALRQGIHLRGYAQKNPKQEYKREAFALFTKMLDGLKRDVVSTLAMLEVSLSEDVEAIENNRRQMMRMQNVAFNHPDVGQRGETETEMAVLARQKEEPSEKVLPFVRDPFKVGRNEICPCGSGKKYKNCHGQLN